MSGPLGLERGRVELALDPQSSWPESFARLRGELSDALGGDALAIEHVGSTAVPGLVAKPIIDIAVALREEVSIQRLRARLESAGYLFRGDPRNDGGILFVLEDEPRRRIAHVHLMAHEDRRWDGYLAFRDTLRRDPEARRSYAEIKQRLAREFPDDRASYTAAKSTFVEQVVSGVSGPPGRC
jgi:GrpB-like predicted nucleotidyltransferase (UPF0157 family)